MQGKTFFFFCVFKIDQKISSTETPEMSEAFSPKTFTQSKSDFMVQIILRVMKMMIMDIYLLEIVFPKLNSQNMQHNIG